MSEFISRLPNENDVIEKYIAIYGEREFITNCVKLVIKREYWQQKKWDWDQYFEDLFIEKDIHT